MKPKIPLAQSLSRLNAARVDYLMIGVLAVNHYAQDPSSVYSTLDCDLLLRPDPGNLLRALKALLRAGCRLEADGEPLGKPDPLLCRRIVDNHGTVTALKPGGMPIDLVLIASRAEFAALRRRRRVFIAAGIRVPCAGLADVLKAKRRAGRAKDRAFLKLYEARHDSQAP